MSKDPFQLVKNIPSLELLQKFEEAAMMIATHRENPERFTKKVLDKNYATYGATVSELLKRLEVEGWEW